MGELMKKHDVLQAIYQALKIKPFKESDSDTMAFAIAMLKDIPTVETDDSCICGNPIISEKFEYCPYCGRKLKKWN